MNNKPIAADAPRPLNERFVAYLDQLYAPRGHRRWHVLAGMTVGALLVAAVLVLALGLNTHAAWPLLPLGIVLFGRGIVALQGIRRARQQFQNLRNVVKNGVPITAYIVQAHEGLFKPGSGPLPCLVLFSFQSEVESEGEYMRYLADRLFALKNTQPTDVDGRYLANLCTDEHPVPYRRRRLPNSFTDGSTIYCADLWVKRAYLRGGYLRGNTLPCLAEPGDVGGIELIPSWLLTPSEEMTLAGRATE
jgi:hypothetical protein